MPNLEDAHRFECLGADGGKMNIQKVLSQLYRHPMLDFVAGIVLVAAAMVELDRPGASALSMAYALGLLGIIHMMRGAGQILDEEPAQNRIATPGKGDSTPVLTFKPPKALPPPLPNNILSMELAKERRIRRRERKEQETLEALTQNRVIAQNDIQTREKA